MREIVELWGVDDVIAATPIDGGHYFVDVLAGSAIAAVAIYVSRARARWGARGVGAYRPASSGDHVGSEA